MNHSLLILVLLGLAAALMPWQFALEVYLFGEEKGVEKAAAFVGGITLFRVLLIFVIGLLFAGLTAVITEKIVDVAEFAHRLLALLGREVMSGQREFLDLLLVLSGLLLLFEAYRYYRRSTADLAVEETEHDAHSQRSLKSLFFLGMGWMAISLNQWLFTLTAANQILFITNGLAGRVLLSLLFLLLASLMILLPFVIYFFKRESAVAVLERLTATINSTFSYLIIALMVAGGAYLVWIGARGLLKYVSLL